MQDRLLEFTERVDAAIKGAPHLARRKLRCVVRDGEVTLRGVVESYFQKQMAQEAVQRVDGVQSVANELRVSQGDDCEPFTKDVF